jgi:hypothetical protein
MKLSLNSLENGIFSPQDYANLFSYLDDDTLVEIHQLIMVDYFYQACLISIIKLVKSKDYQQARQDYHDGWDPINDFSVRRRTLKSLLKGLLATSAMVCSYEISNAKSSWSHFETDNPQDHHYIVYQEFKKVETMEDLKRFNSYFHDYILNLIFMTAEIFNTRLHNTIEYLKGDERFEEACATGLQNIEKFERELEEGRNFSA